MRKKSVLSLTIVRLCGGAVAGLTMLAACTDAGPDAEPVSERREAPNLAGTVWQAEDIDSGGIIDNSHITVQITADGRIAGSSGCNRYFGALSVDAAAFLVDGLGSTRKACAPALMQQEQRFLKALQETRRFERDGDFLRLYDEAGVPRIHMVYAPQGSAAMPEASPQDRVMPGTHQARRFECPDGPAFEVRFEGPETLTLSLPGQDHVLQRERTASGAKYSGDGIVFWNKGDNATLEINGLEHRCEKTS